jgi:hypothetical protein
MRVSRKELWWKSNVVIAEFYGTYRDFALAKLACDLTETLVRVNCEG